MKAANKRKRNCSQKRKERKMARKIIVRVRNEWQERQEMTLSEFQSLAGKARAATATRQGGRYVSEGGPKHRRREKPHPDVPGQTFIPGTEKFNHQIAGDTTPSGISLGTKEEKKSPAVFSPVGVAPLFLGGKEKRFPILRLSSNTLRPVKLQKAGRKTAAEKPQPAGVKTSVGSKKRPKNHGWIQF